MEESWECLELAVSVADLEAAFAIVSRVNDRTAALIKRFPKCPDYLAQRDASMRIMAAITVLAQRTMKYAKEIS